MRMMKAFRRWAAVVGIAASIGAVVTAGGCGTAQPEASRHVESASAPSSVGPTVTFTATPTGGSPDTQPAEPPAPGGPGGGQTPGAGEPQYTIEQAISDRAQQNTIAFDALGFWTGNLASDSFFPPGKLADFWGFQYLRDNDPSEMGHNTDFLTGAALNVLSVLTVEQRAELIALAESQTESINEFGYRRFVLMKAFRRLFEGDLPSGAAGLDEAAVKAFSADLYALDGRITLERAQVMGPILARLSADQKAYLDAMVGKGMSSWPKVTEPADLKGLSRDQKVAVMTYAGDMFSWYAGSLEADVYFCPERHGTYFGSFYLKDAPAVGNPGYSIDTTLTGNLGASLLSTLNAPQAARISGLVESQRASLNEIVKVRGEVASELREALAGGSIDSAAVLAGMKTYGELDGEIVHLYATAFAEVGRGLSAAQKTRLTALRDELLGDLSLPVSGAYLFSQAIPMPDLPSTDFLFGAGGGDQDGDSSDSAFTDISTSPYGEAIEGIASRGIVGGFPDGSFRPDEAVSRQQFAKMIVKTLVYPVSAADVCPFSDVAPGQDPSDPLYPTGYVAVCAAKSITNGTEPGTFSPGGSITRAQLITMVAREAEVGEAPPGYSPGFPNFSPDHFPWAARAAYAGLLEGLQGVGATYDFWAPSTRGECAQLLSRLLSPGDPPVSGEAAFPGTVILGRPTDAGATVSIVPPADTELYVEYGTAAGVYTAQTARQMVAAGRPLELALTGLPPDCECFYRICFGSAGPADFLADAEYSFHTQRAAGATFSFAVEADPHIDVDNKMQPSLFRQELGNVAAADPDFLIDLGDTFLGDKLPANRAAIEAQYVNVRSYFDISGPSVPLFLVNGNHEGESGWLLNGSADNLAVWATNARKAYYPNPSPDGFYSGGGESEPYTGPRESYYAWEWGDALFVVLDPYYYTSTNPKQSDDLWDYTLGEDQYRWLADVLRESTAEYKFVFMHHILGDVRGGVEWAGLYEWGGGSKDGTWRFDVERPGWDLPLHQLFVETGVTIFFQGHDHFYAKQEKNGVIYQEVPQPATQGDPHNKAHEYAYRSGVILGGTGHLLVTVAPAGVTVDYIQSGPAAGGGSGGGTGTANGDVIYSYTVGS